MRARAPVCLTKINGLTSRESHQHMNRYRSDSIFFFAFAQVICAEARLMLFFAAAFTSF